jgi:hypothetical protein
MDEGKNNMPFDVPTIWHEPSSHLEDRYFSLTKIEGNPMKR